jgi:enoyl-[acyl-carrier-protein] reductase (NADH)
VGEVAAWLCSAAARMIVGQTIEVDGGYSLLAF